MCYASIIKDKLYRVLKQEKIPTERQYFVYDTTESYCLDFAVFCKNGKINIECDGEKYHLAKQIIARDRKRNNDLASIGWSVLRFTGKEINRDMATCIKRIKQTIKTLNELT